MAIIVSPTYVICYSQPPLKYFTTLKNITVSLYLHGVLRRQNVGRLTALIPCLHQGRCQDVGKDQDTAPGRKAQSEIWESWSWFRSPQAYDKARKVGFSNPWTSACDWESHKNREQIWGPMGSRQHLARSRVKGSAVLSQAEAGLVVIMARSAKKTFRGELSCISVVDGSPWWILMKDTVHGSK